MGQSMKREKFLWPLSQSHHRALLLARKVKDRLSGAEPGKENSLPRELSAEIQNLFKDELRKHFWDEERILGLFEERMGKGDPDVERIRKEHRLLESLGMRNDRESLVFFSETLTGHIRFEEDVLFPRFEKVLADDEKKVVGEMLAPLAGLPGGTK
jgi:hemerythrin-like domain-containing protein